MSGLFTIKKKNHGKGANKASKSLVTWGPHGTAIPCLTCCKTSLDGTVAWASGTGKCHGQVVQASVMGR